MFCSNRYQYLFWCVCINIVIICIITIYNIYVVDDSINNNENLVFADEFPVLTNKNLRSMFMEDVTNQVFTHIYDSVNSQALKGKRGLYFPLLCIPNPDNCVVYNDHKQWWERRNQRDGGVILSDNQTQEIINSILDNLQIVFPDSNITKDNKNCCDRYRISW